MYEAKMTRPKSERRCFGALLGRVFHVQFTLSKGMPFAVTIQEPVTAVSREKMLADTDQLLSEFASDYKRMAE